MASWYASFSNKVRSLKVRIAHFSDTGNGGVGTERNFCVHSSRVSVSGFGGPGLILTTT